MTTPRRLYLDNAATSSPKPPAVLEAMVDYVTRLGGSPGRGSYLESREAGDLVWRCRQRVCALIAGSSPDHVVFTLNTSDALNLAIKGIVMDALSRSSGAVAHVVTTTLDHNSVLRPLHALGELFPGRVTSTRVPFDPSTGLVDPEDVRRAVRAHAGTVLVAVNHASNVTGVIQPAAEIGRLCRELGVPFLLDAAQSLGHVPVDVRALGVDLLAFPGHKGLLGPTGTGGLYIRPGLEARLRPLREGGTGSRSELAHQPQFMPDKYEPGSPNAMGLIGLSEGVRFLTEFEHAGLRGMDAIAAHERALMHRFLAAIDEHPEIELLGPRTPAGRVGVFSVRTPGVSPHELAAALEASFGVLTRAGLHCAPLAHEAMGTGAPDGGATRLSLGPFVSEDDVAFAAHALVEVASSLAGAGTPVAAR